MYRGTLKRMELTGDSARGEDWAFVRLQVENDVIVDAEATGLDRDVRGLTLLEAAAVGGEVLAADALARQFGLRGVHPIQWSYARAG